MNKPPKLSWDDLANIGRTLKEQRKAQERAQKRREQEAARAHAERNLFQHTVGAVQPIKRARTAHIAPPKPDATPVQTQQDRQQVMQESMGLTDESYPSGTDAGISDHWEPIALMAGDEQLSYSRPGVPPHALVKLRRGHWRIQAQVDLHHLQTDTAREAVSAFIKRSHRHGLRCVRVIHGKGYGSDGGISVLKQKVPRWLMQKKQVLAFVQAREADGGAGAVVVLLDRPPTHPSSHAD